MNALFNLIQNDRFRTSDNRTFKVVNVWFRGGKPCDVEFIEIKEEPEPVELISQPYEIIQELVINKKIILL
jgi:hypothetical protein